MQYGIFLILQIVILTVAQGQNMVFYGTTSSGGLNNQGVIFKTDNNGENYTVVHDFNAEDGMRPGYGNLCNVNGVLYGTTDIGGVNNMGVLFSYNIITALYTKLHDFDEQTGQRPKSQVIQASNGKLYGT
ncbi:MAG TPA: choice-of-anchor tandem repeat GloVer-containing protein, partial [Xanthomarina sp.]|nr:choice-of-anchor tandem repeat GloVer-containing protein [Xanthomarina sp.]